MKSHVQVGPRQKSLNAEVHPGKVSLSPGSGAMIAFGKSKLTPVIAGSICILEATGAEEE